LSVLGFTPDDHPEHDRACFERRLPITFHGREAARRESQAGGLAYYRLAYYRHAFGRPRPEALVRYVFESIDDDAPLSNLPISVSMYRRRPEPAAAPGALGTTRPHLADRDQGFVSCREYAGNRGRNRRVRGFTGMVTTHDNDSGSTGV
jgi:hypothetical protein